MPFGKRRLACSFCGRGEAEVSKLVAGPRVYICDRCAEAAIQIMNTGGDAAPRPPGALSWFRRALRTVGQTVRRYVRTRFDYTCAWSE